MTTDAISLNYFVNTIGDNAPFLSMCDNMYDTCDGMSMSGGTSLADDASNDNSNHGSNRSSRNNSNDNNNSSNSNNSNNNSDGDSIESTLSSEARETNKKKCTKNMNFVVGGSRCMNYTGRTDTCIKRSPTGGHSSEVAFSDPDSYSIVGQKHKQLHSSDISSISSISLISSISSKEEHRRLPKQLAQNDRDNDSFNSGSSIRRHLQVSRSEEIDRNVSICNNVINSCTTDWVNDADIERRKKEYYASKRNSNCNNSNSNSDSNIDNNSKSNSNHYNSNRSDEDVPIAHSRGKYAKNIAEKAYTSPSFPSFPSFPPSSSSTSFSFPSLITDSEKKEKNRLTAINNRIKEKQDFEQEKETLASLKELLAQLEKNAVAKILLNIGDPNPWSDNKCGSISSTSVLFDNKGNDVLYSNLYSIEDLKQRAKHEVYDRSLERRSDQSLSTAAGFASMSKENALYLNSDDDSDDCDGSTSDGTGSKYLDRKEKNKLKSRRSRNKKKILRQLIQQAIAELKERINVLKKGTF